MSGLGIKMLKSSGCDISEMLTGTLGERATLVCGSFCLLLVTPEIVRLFLHSRVGSFGIPCFSVCCAFQCSPLLQISGTAGLPLELY